MTRGSRVFYRRQSFDGRHFRNVSIRYPYWLHRELQFRVRAYRNHWVLV